MRLGRSLGYGRVASFTFLLWPPVYRQIRLAVFAVVAYATSVVDVALILGPHLPPTLPVRLIDWMNDPNLESRFLASAGAILQLGVTLAALIVWVVLERIGAFVVTRIRDNGGRWRRDMAVRAFCPERKWADRLRSSSAASRCWQCGSVSGLWQFPDALPSSFTFRSWMQALPRMSGPLGTTLSVAGLSTLIALTLTILCLEREYETGRGRGGGALLLIYLPLIVPQISFMFGLQVLSIWLGVDASFLALVLAHLVFVLPYVFLSLSDPWRAHDRRHDLIAAGLGMSRTRTLVKIRLPMLTRAIPDGGGGRVFRLGRAIPADRAHRRRAADHGHHRGGGAGGRRQPPRHRRLCLHADAAAVFRIRHCNGIAGLGIPQPARLAGVTMKSVTKTEGLVLDDVRIRLGDRLLVALDSRVRRGETLTVMGPSGSGKSTLLAYLGGFLDPAFFGQRLRVGGWRRPDGAAGRETPCRHPVSGSAAVSTLERPRQYRHRHSRGHPRPQAKARTGAGST